MHNVIWICPWSHFHLTCWLETTKGCHRSTSLQLSIGAMATSYTYKGKSMVSHNNINSGLHVGLISHRRPCRRSNNQQLDHTGWLKINLSVEIVPCKFLFNFGRFNQRQPAIQFLNSPPGHMERKTFIPSMQPDLSGSLMVDLSSELQLIFTNVRPLPKKS